MSEAASVIPSGFDDLLQSNALAHIATIGPKGEPQTSPVWFDWDGEYIRFGHDARRQKYRNLQREPRIALSIVDQTNPYRYLELRGRLVRVEADDDASFINRMTKKYMGVDTYPYSQPDDQRVVIVIKPERASHMG